MNWQEIVSNFALTCVIIVAILLILMVIFLFALVISLTFDCWWSLGRFFNIEEEDVTGLLTGSEQRLNQKRPWLLRVQNGKIHNVREFVCSDIEMI